MTSGSPALWSLAESLSIVPAPPDPIIEAMLSGWWSIGRTFGCPNAREGQWFVVMPDPVILCGVCAAEAYEVERRCAYCQRPVRVSRAVTLVYEMGGVDVMGRGHRHCAEKARTR